MCDPSLALSTECWPCLLLLGGLFWDRTVLDVIFCVCLSGTRHWLGALSVCRVHFGPSRISFQGNSTIFSTILFMTASVCVPGISESHMGDAAVSDSNVRRIGEAFFSGLLDSSKKISEEHPYVSPRPRSCLMSLYGPDAGSYGM